MQITCRYSDFPLLTDGQKYLVSFLKTKLWDASRIACSFWDERLDSCLVDTYLILCDSLNGETWIEIKVQSMQSFVEVMPYDKKCIVVTPVLTLTYFDGFFVYIT